MKDQKYPYTAFIIAVMKKHNLTSFQQIDALKTSPSAMIFVEIMVGMNCFIAHLIQTSANLEDMYIEFEAHSPIKNIPFEWLEKVFTSVSKFINHPMPETKAELQALAPEISEPDAPSEAPQEEAQIDPPEPQH